MNPGYNFLPVSVPGGMGLKLSNNLFEFLLFTECPTGCAGCDHSASPVTCTGTPQCIDGYVADSTNCIGRSFGPKSVKNVG